MSKSWSTAPGTVQGYAGVVALSLLISVVAAVYRIGGADVDPAASGALSGGLVDVLRALGLVVALGFHAIVTGVYGWLIYKLGRGRKWAWIVLLVLESLNLLFALVDLMSGGLLSLLATILQVVSLGLLIMPDTRDYVEDNGMAPASNGYPIQNYGANPPPAERLPDQALYTDWQSRSERW